MHAVSGYCALCKGVLEEVTSKCFLLLSFLKQAYLSIAKASLKFVFQIPLVLGIVSLGL